MAEYTRVVRLERELVLRLLPDPVRADRTRAEALIAMLSFQTWRALRRDPALTVEDAGSVLTHMVAALVAAIPERYRPARLFRARRPEERRVGEERRSTCRAR